jgi:hypothetical protein
MHPELTHPTSVSKQFRLAPDVWKTSGTAGSAFEPHAADDMPTPPVELQQKPPPA